MMRWLFIIVLMMTSFGAAIAHEARPGFLQVIEETPATYSFTWRRSLTARDLALVSPIIPEDCSIVGVPSITKSGQSRSEVWRLECESPLTGLEFSGLLGTQNEVFLDVQLIDRPPIKALLQSKTARIDFETPQSGVIEYLRIGVEHLVFGIDHVLFVICLFLFIRTPIRLIQTLTAFTLAHSLTLGLTVLGFAYPPQRPVEALIAISILFLCREFMLPEHRRSYITMNTPWVMAFGFGLLHGFGFAGALGDIGLPQNQLLLSLFLFNVGIEVGQLFIVAILGILGWLTHRFLQERTRLVEQTAVFIMGCYAGLWTIERCALLV
ncbi:MAG: HupE/UreJ family protein [Pseudomonadota bacterium]